MINFVSHCKSDIVGGSMMVSLALGCVVYVCVCI